MIRSKWTVFFLLLAAAALAITPTAGSLSVITFFAAGLFLVLAFIFALKNRA